jgi:hypothetical protein
MRNVILGTIAGLILGTACTLAYSHYMGDNGMLADLQSQLADAKAKLAKALAENTSLKREKSDVAEQVDQLNTTNDTLKKQLTDQGQTPETPPAATAPAFDPALVSAIMGMMRRGGGGFRSPEERMLLMQTRLKLTADQMKTIRAAMDADQQARRDLFQQARQNGTRPDPAALEAVNSLDKTIATTLSTTQQSEYQQLQADEKSARAESNATSQVDQLMPLLQLTDDQKGKAMNLLYQQQLSAADPATLVANPTTAVATLTAQGQTAQSSLQKVLSADQYALYQQQQQLQAQTFANFGGRRGGNGNGNGGNQNNGGGNGTAATPAATAAPAPAATTTTDSSTAASTNAVPSNAAVTNAAPATADAGAPPPPPPN